MAHAREAIDAAYERIRPVVRETPVEPWGDAGENVFLKLEHLQHTGSFKFRGASNKIAILTPEQLSLHEQSTTLSLRQQETMMDAIKSMAPSAIVTLQEFLDEAPSPRASPPQGESR